MKKFTFRGTNLVANRMPELSSRSLSIVLSLVVVSAMCGCRSIKESPKYKFDDGFYFSSIDGKTQRMYIENNNDSIIVYAAAKGMKRLNVKEASEPVAGSQRDTLRANTYWKQSFDLDFLTVPMKLRPSVSGFPTQFSNNLNGMVYTGYRRDMYRLTYNKNPLGKMNQKTLHYGISAGLATGLSTTAMNPYVTHDQITIEYDGLVWSKGIVILTGVERFTFGVIGAVDHLLDSNKKFWIYQGKPYAGVVIGLNIN